MMLLYSTEENKPRTQAYVDDLTLVENTFYDKTSTIQDNLEDFDEWADINTMNLFCFIFVLFIVYELSCFLFKD